MARICGGSGGRRHAGLHRRLLDGKVQEGQDQTVTVLVSDITLAIELDDQESASCDAPPPGQSVTSRPTDRGRSPQFPSECQPSAATDPSRINRDTARIRVMTPRPIRRFSQFALPGWVGWERRSRIGASIGYAGVVTKDIAGLD